MIDFDIVFDKKKPIPRYERTKVDTDIRALFMSEVMFEDTFNPFGRSNIPFDSSDYLNPEQVTDPLSGVSGYNPASWV